MGIINPDAKTLRELSALYAEAAKRKEDGEKVSFSGIRPVFESRK